VHRGLGAPGFVGFVLAALVIGWISGRLGQRIFDDEAISLAVIDGRSYGALLAFYLGGGDVHPPLPFLWLRLMHDLQVPIWLQRALSLAAASTGFALVLDLLWRRQPERLLRMAAAALFLATPLLYGMGASLRWYPLLVLPTALAIWSLDRAERPTVPAAVAFGIAANISFLAIIPAFAYGLWRYAFARRFAVRLDGPFIAIAMLVALPGLIAFFSSAGHLPAQADSNVLIALSTTALGVLGGYGLGLSHSLLAVPLAVLLTAGVVAAFVALRQRPVGSLLAIALVVLLSFLVLTTLGVAKPRSFLFAVPFVLAAVLVAAGQLGWRWYAPATAAAAIGVTLAALWLLEASDRPFKRNLRIPDDAVLEVVHRFAPKDGSVIVSSDPSLGWRLRQDGYCVIAASLPGGCARESAPVIVTIDDGTFTQRPGFSNQLGKISLEHRLIHQQVFGDDEDGPTKTFLTGRLVPKWLASLAIYKRD